MNPLVYGICVVNEPSISGKESLESGKESKFGKESNGKESKCKCSETSYVTLIRTVYTFSIICSISIQGPRDFPEKYCFFFYI